MICVECGAEANRLIGGCCAKCFVAKTPLLTVPPVLDIELCAHCDARHVGAHWVDPDEGVPLDWIREDAARGAIRVHQEVREPQVDAVETVQDERNFRFKVSVRGSVDGVPVTDSKEFVVRLRRSSCDRCSRMVGGYYAAVIQLRATQRDVTPLEIERTHAMIGTELDRQRASGNREAFLTKSGAVPGGFDYYMGDIEGTRAVSRVVAERLGAQVIESAKLVGRKEGEDIYRVTFLVRIRLLAPGDFCLLDGEPAQFSTLDRGKAICLPLATHKRTRVDEDKLRRLGGWEVLQQAVIVSQDAHTIQVMDPVSYLTYDISKPEGFEAEGESLWVLRHEERLYVPAVQPPKPVEKPSKRRPAVKSTNNG